MRDRLTNRRLKEIAALTRKKYRERSAEMLVEGKRSVEAALDAGAPLRDVLVTETAARASDVRPLIARVDVPLHVVPDELLAELSAVETSQGILAVAAIETVVPAALHSFRRILVLDGLRDPGNVGTLIRTAAWFGVDAVATAAGTVDLYNPKAVRAAMGALWDVKHAPVDDLPSLLAELRRNGFVLYGAHMAGTSASEWTPSEKSVLVLGSEAHGMKRDVIKLMDECVVVRGASSRTATESLNVAVAAGILMYQWVR